METLAALLASTALLLPLWYLGASILVAVVAGQKGRPGFTWFIFALLLTPVFAILCVIALPDRRRGVVSEAGESAPSGLRSGLTESNDLNEVVRKARKSMRSPTWPT